MEKNKVKVKHRIKPGKIVLQIFMTVLALLFLTPIFIIINYSFKTKKELYLNSPLSLPESLNFDNYIKAFDKLDLVTTFGNTLFYTVISVFLLAVLCGVTAWAIARCKRKFFKFCYVYFIVGILIRLFSFRSILSVLICTLPIPVMVLFSCTWPRAYPSASF